MYCIKRLPPFPKLDIDQMMGFENHRHVHVRMSVHHALYVLVVKATAFLFSRVNLAAHTHSYKRKKPWSFRELLEFPLECEQYQRHKYKKVGFLRQYIQILLSRSLSLKHDMSRQSRAGSISKGATFSPAISIATGKPEF